MLKSFASEETEDVWRGIRSRSLPDDLQRIARRKLRMINNAQDSNDVRIPPVKRLETPKGDRVGQHSIRINQQWRISIRWRDGDAAQ